MRPIFLIGFMGSGKSTLGRQLANQLSLPFIDMDKFIEKKNGTTVQELFTQLGEEGFRRLEREVLEELAKTQTGIIATGGGAPCFFSNMQHMNEWGTTIYLRISPRELCVRLSVSSTERPLLKGLHDDELLNFITEKIAAREVYYLKAQHIVEDDDIKTEDLLKVLNNKK
jgi:shikimate kinase